MKRQFKNKNSGKKRNQMKNGREKELFEIYQIKINGKSNSSHYQKKP
jgi:hypothetical protein